MANIPLIFFGSFLVIISMSVASPSVPWRLVGTYSHDSTSFTEGILIHDGFIYESAGLYRKSRIFRDNLVEMDSTDPTPRISLPLADKYFAEGLSLFVQPDGNVSLFQLTWKEKAVFKYQLNEGQIQPSSLFSLQDTFNNPATEGWGLTTNGSHLIMSTGASELLIMDPVDFKVVGSVQVRDGTSTVININELEYIPTLNEVWANIWLTNKVIRIDLETGNVLSYLDCSSLKRSQPRSAQEMNGIAYDHNSDMILLTGKNWNAIYHIQLE